MTKQFAEGSARNAASLGTPVGCGRHFEHGDRRARLDSAGKWIALALEPVDHPIDAVDGTVAIELRKETVHDRYKDSSQVERAFRTCKTVELEMRPIHVRLGNRTRGHAFVVMRAYRIVQELASRWVDLDMTVEEGLKKLSTLCATDITFDEKTYCRSIPKPHPSLQSLFN